MSMRKLIWVGTVAAMAGAGCTGKVDGQGAVKGDDPTLAMSGSGCGYPQYGCGTGNGTGVYYQEGGYAGMDSIQFLITHFINNGSSVGVQGRYRVNNTWYVLDTPGNVYQATYFGYTYPVVSITETGTYPTITLQIPGTATTFSVSGAALQWVQPSVFLYLSNTTPRYYNFQLMFAPAGSDAGTGAYSATTVYKYNMWYQNTYTGEAWTNYCNDAAGNTDPVVFQGGIDVTPWAGQVTSNSSDVTLSCRQGAIATAYYWGYDYRSDWWHYAAAIHMKRASYCGDDKFFTVAGTHITILDDWFTQMQFPNGGIEALWTPYGASCFNQSRRPDGDPTLPYWWQEPQGTMLYERLQPFDLSSAAQSEINLGQTGAYGGRCALQLLPPCPPLSALVDSNYNTLQTFLLDGVVWPQ
jgi:hypothetical protein